MLDKKGLHYALYAQDGLGCRKAIHLCSFAHPMLQDMVVKNTNPSITNADITIINLRQSFNKAQAKFKIYNNYAEFIAQLKTLFAGTISETGIYTNIRWSDDALAGVVNYIVNN